MLIKYIEAALRQAHYELLEDGGIYGSIPALRGVWANAPTLEARRAELEEVLQDWLMLSLSKDLPIPRVAEGRRTIEPVLFAFIHVHSRPNVFWSPGAPLAAINYPSASRPDDRSPACPPALSLLSNPTRASGLPR